MSSQEVLILFIAAVIVASITVYALNTQFQLALSKASSSSSVATKRAGTAFEILSVYGDASETNIAVKGILGSVDVNSFTVFVDNVPYTPSSGRFLRDSDGDGVLDPSDVYVMTISAAVDPDNNCVRVDSPYAEDIYGNCYG